MPNEPRPDPWPVVSREEKGDFEIFRARALTARSPRDGSEHTFHIADAPDGVTVLAVTPADELVLVQQWRHPLGRVTLEAPAGIMDPGETPEQAAIRELREETGYEGAPPEPLGCVVLNPSWQTTRLHALLVRDARPSGDKELDAGEDTRVCRIPLAQARSRVLAGDIDSATAIAALALLEWRNGGAGRG